ncbi:hypothetical protein Bpfe_006511, partial [Biomphalaria pfeifferi]
AVEGTRCSYKVLPRNDKIVGAKNFYMATEMAHKDCQWGCCFDQKEDVCCSFPMDAVVFAFIATIAIIIVVALIIILLCYIHSKKTKTHIECNGPILIKDRDQPKLLILP